MSVNSLFHCALIICKVIGHVWATKKEPRLEGLKLEMEKTQVRVSEVVPIKVTRIPESATLDKLSFRVDPPSLGIYDTATRSFYAKESGRGTVTVFDKAGTVKASCDVSVSGAPSGKGCLGLAAMGVIGFISLMLVIII